MNSPKDQKVQVWPGLSSFVAVMGPFRPPVVALPRHFASGLCAGPPFSPPRHLNEHRAAAVIVPRLLINRPPACPPAGLPVSMVTASTANVIPEPWGRGRSSSTERASPAGG